MREGVIRTTIPRFTLRPAGEHDIELILMFIKALAVYERLEHEVVATASLLRETLFGDRQIAEVIIGEYDGEPVSFALFFHSFSTFLGRPGLYLEDLFVQPAMRSRGLGRVMLTYLAHLAQERQCGRVEWSVLDWNESARRFYRSLGAGEMDAWTVHRLTGEPLARLAAEF
jgi:GNAT superfamily N-acetyltransferase